MKNTLKIPLFTILTLMICISAALTASITAEAADEYTNTGDFYYAEVDEGLTHTITITVADDKATIVSDDWVKEMRMNKYWMIPLFSYKDQNNDEQMYFLECVINQPQYDDTAFTRGLRFQPGDDSTHLLFEITIIGNRVSVDVDSVNIISDAITHLFLSKTGDYVYSQRPVFNNDTKIILMDGFDAIKNTPQNGSYKYMAYFGSGTINDIRNKIYGTDGIPADITPPTYKVYLFKNRNTVGYDIEHTYNISGITMDQPTTTETKYGLKLYGMNVQANMYWNDDHVNIDTILTHAIVPVTVVPTTDNDGNSNTPLATIGNSTWLMIAIGSIISLIIGGIYAIKKFR